MTSDRSAVLTREGLDALIAAPGNAGDRVCGPTARERAIVYGDISGAEDPPEGDGGETFALFGERARELAALQRPPVRHRTGA